MSARETLYSVGDVRGRFPCREVWIRGPGDVLEERRRFASDFGINESAVWSEVRKTTSGHITRTSSA